MGSRRLICCNGCAEYVPDDQLEMHMNYCPNSQIDDNPFKNKLAMTLEALDDYCGRNPYLEYKILVSPKDLYNFREVIKLLKAENIKLRKELNDLKPEYDPNSNCINPETLTKWSQEIK